MKKLFLSILVSLGLLFALPVSTFADTTAKTNITGVVTDNGSPVAGAKVTVECNNHAKKDTTNATGAYLVTFKAVDCPAGAIVHVIAKKGHKGGFSQGTASPVTTKLNVGVVNVALPEFSTVAGISAVGLAGGSLMIVRRRKVGQN